MQQYKDKETRINKAILKVQGKLAQYEMEAEKIQGNWSEADQQRFKDWNSLHDLEYRLEQRLWSNWSEFKEWHWNKYQFNTYP